LRIDEIFIWFYPEFNEVKVWVKTSNESIWNSYFNNDSSTYEISTSCHIYRFLRFILVTFDGQKVTTRAGRQKSPEYRICFPLEGLYNCLRERDSGIFALAVEY